MAGINLQDYVSVAERVNQAKNDIRSIHADQPVMLSDVMGYIRCTVVLKDERSATGTASFRLDLQGRSAQATNPIEDCETSAIGRALALLGYSSSKSIASREEMQETQRREASYDRPAATNGNGDAPVCDVCGTRGRLGKNGKDYFCPNKSAHGDKWYTIPAAVEDDLL